MDQTGDIKFQNISGGGSDAGLAVDSLWDLIEKVVHGFVASLQQDSVDMWQSFNEILAIIQSYSSLLEGNAQLMHYVERTYDHFCDNPSCGLDVNALSLAFPHQMSIMQQHGKHTRKVKFPSGSLEVSEVCLPIESMDEKRGISVPKATVVRTPCDIYDDQIERFKSILPDKELHISDLRRSLPFVVHEIGLREASWGRPLGITAAALNIDLAEMIPELSSPQDPQAYLIEGASPNSIKSDNKSVKEEKAERRPLTGREVVERFVKGSFLGMTKFAYLNRAPSKHFDPYNLVVVPRNKMEPEHYVVSSHAILHVTPNSPSELQPLAEWYKEAILFSAMLKFSFFKNFLVAKMFLRWRQVKKMHQFQALCSQVGGDILASIPSFGSALLRVSSLIQDLDQVQLLPLEDTKCRSLQEFNNVTIKLLDDAQECLKMFFSYSLSVINKTKDNCFEYLEYCKEQLQRKSRNPKGSLSLAKEMKAVKVKNMKHAYCEIHQLGRFVKLVEQILLAKLLTLARYNVCTFVHKVLDNGNIKDKGLFSVSLQFNKKDKLVLVPSFENVQGSLFFAVESVMRIVCQSSESVDEEFCENGGHKWGTDDSPACTSSERSDSKPPDENSPNKLQSFLLGQSPVVSAPGTSLPTLSACGRHGEVDSEAEDDADAVNLHGKNEYLKSLFTESLQETLDSSRTTKEEGRPESSTACISPTGVLMVEGREIQAHSNLTSPLSKAKLEITLLRDEEILAAVNKEEEIVNSALEEVREFCRKHEWVVQINKFVRTWNTAKLASWRGRSPERIEKHLSQIKAWIEEMSDFAKSFCTTNGLLLVDCSGIRDNLVPKLDAIFRQLTKMIAKDLLRMSKDFSDEVTQLAEKLSNKCRDLKGFAEYMTAQKSTKEKVPALQVKVEYIKSLFEMIRCGHRQLTRVEEQAEESTWASWEGFLLCLQESSDFLLVETSHVLRDLEETIMSLEHQLRVIGERAVRGEFLIPENNPTMILSQLRQLRQNFLSLLNQLDELIACREVMCGRKYNKSHLLEILNQVDVRYQLWKYYDVSAHTIKDWLQMPFRKMNVKKVTEKITEWQLAAENLKVSLSDGDEVYESWVKQMESFMKDFPLLQQLSNDALKPRHWKALFVGMGQQYDADWQFTIADLFSYKIGLYKDLINSVYSGALKEYALELQLRSLAKTWTDKDFKLAKHFARTKSSLDGETDSLAGKTPSRQGARSRQNHSRLTDMYILTGDDELKCLIEDNRVTLQLMSVSPYVADLKPTVERWMKSLEQLEEILELWVACQKKWLYLFLVLNENSGSYRKAVVDRFEQVDSRFKEFMQTVVKDSKVLSILAKKRGEKGYRELQGEALRSMLFLLLKEQEELLKSVERNMEKVREAFPRMYFLSDSEVLDIMVISRDPRKLLPVVRKCFPGIKSVKFGLPGDSATKLSTALDAALNAHLLQVTAIEGEFGEIVVLNEPIHAGMDSQTWLTVFEKSMKAALMVNFTKCMVNWLSPKHQTTAVSDILGKDGYKENTFPDTTEAEGAKSKGQASEIPWLLKYPSQCIRSAEAVAWSYDVSRALSCQDKSELKALSLFTNRRVNDYAKVLGGKEYTWLTNIPRVRPTLESLVVCSIHQRDVVERILACGAVCSHCFEWQSCLQHRVSLKQVFSTTYCTGLPGTSRPISSQERLPLDMKYETEEYNVCLLGSEFPYGFEYLGERVSMVVTPLTERCFLTLSMALKSYSCGTPLGYNGSGKTETIRELAKMMGRHIVFFNCSHSMASSVATRLLTGMVLSGSWICFEDAQNLPQRMLSTLGEHLGGIRESYKCLIINRRNEYCVRGTSMRDVVKDAEKEAHTRRRNSLTTFDTLTVLETTPESPTDVPFSNVTKKSATISRRFSIAEGRNLNETDYYGDQQPLPISIPLTPNASRTDCELFTCQEKDETIAYQQPRDISLGNIVFNGMLLQAHHMAGCFMTITPTTDGYLNVPDNLKVSLRTVAMTLPDMKRILEVWLLCNGFNDVGVLAEKIMFFIKVIRDRVPSEHDIQTNSLKNAIRVAGSKLRLDQSSIDSTKDEVADPDEVLEGQRSKEEVEGIASATSFLEEFENRTKEESAVVHGIFSVLCPKLDEESRKIVCEITDTIFTHTVLTSSTQTNAERVAEAVREQLSAESLQLNMDLVSKVIQLYQILQTNHAAIIMGSSGTGKTTIYQTLCRAINSLNTQVAHDSTVGEERRGSLTPAAEQIYPKINLSVLFPRAMNENELFGWIDPVTNLWVDGVLVKRARNAEAVKNASESLSSRSKCEKAGFYSHDTGNSTARSDFHQWIVLDGPLDSGCVDQMNSLFDGSRSLSLGNGEMVSLSEKMSFLLELDDLQNAAPSIVSRCGVVYCPDDTVGWKSIFKSWFKGAHGKWNISIRGLGIVSSLMDHCVEKTLTFLNNQCSSILYANYYDKRRWRMGARGIHEIQRMLAILSSLFDKHILRDNDETFDILDHLKDERYSASRASSETGSGRSSCIPASDTGTVISSFAYAFIWAFGGDLHESCIEAFDEFVKGLLSSGPHPHSSLPPVTVFDYHLDFPTGSLLSSTEKLGSATRTITSSYVVVPRTEVYFSLLDLLVAANKPVLLVGPPGSGKTSFLQNLINPRYKYTRVSLAHGMTTQLLQKTIETKVRNTKRRQASRNMFFLDDFNVAATDGTTSNNQPSSELIRSLLSLGGLYDRQRLCFKPLSNTSIVGAAVPSGCPGIGGGVTSFPISPRLARIMVVLSFFPVSGATLQSIYRTLFQTWLEDFPAYSLTHHHHLAKVISSSTINLFETISKDLRPTPVHPHYIFTHHDVARVLQGMMLFSSRTKRRPGPKVRHRRRVVAEQVQTTKDTTVPDNSQSLSSHDVGARSGQEQNDLHQDKSWPMVSQKDTLVSMNYKTPTVLSPMIRVLIRLWCHECTRVFSDRLIGEDKLWFSSMLHQTALQQFCERSLGSDEQDKIVSVRDKVPPGETKSLLESSLEEDVCDDEDIDLKDEKECGQDENTLHDDVPASEVGQKSKLDDLSNVKTGELMVWEGDKETDKHDSVDPISFNDISQSFDQKRHVDSRMSDDSSVDELKFNSQETSMPRTAPSKQRVVTFEDMSREHVYRGPLILPNQLMEQGEDLTKIVFCRHFVSTPQESGPEQDKGYNEYSVAALAEGLKRYQVSYNLQDIDVQPLDLVFFEQAIRHAARLSRCLCLASGHTLLLSKSGHGRKSLVCMASFAANCKLIQFRKNRREDSRQRMKGAIYLAGLQGKPVVLYIPENIDHDTMQDVCSLMSEGNCQGLYTSDELTTICNELIPGSQRGRQNENMIIAQERFFRRVRANLHVVLCLDHPSEKPDVLAHSTFSRYPFLLTRACGIDVYQPWHHSSLTRVSLLRLADLGFDLDVQDIVHSHRNSVAAVMSYIHTSSLHMFAQLFGFNRYKCYSPATFVELVDMFGKCCNRIWKEEQGKIGRCQKALAKVEEANDQINEMEKDLDSFTPILRNAEQEVKNCLRLVESLQGEYAKGREKCKQQEGEIENMMAPIEELERLAKIELDRVSPVFRSAYDALQALNVYDVEEIRSYRTPPDQVVLVVNAVCLLFRKEESWEEGKVLFSREDFIKDLEFFNMKAISEKTFRRLKDYVDNPLFNPEAVKEGSLAAKSICIWIRAVYHFCVVYREYFPKQQRVVEAKKILEEAVAFLGDLRVRCNEIKTEVEAKIEEYKEKVHHARSIEKQIQITEQRKSRTVSLVQSMSMYVKSWKEMLRVCQYHIKTLTGDALLTAACLCYLGPMDQETREKLLTDWKIACCGSTREDKTDNDDYDNEEDVDDFQGGKPSPSCSLPVGIKRIPVRNYFSLRGILTTEEELYNWRHSGLPANATAVENALLMRSVCELSSRHWPLLMDTDLQSYMWVKCLHQTMHSKDPQEDFDFREANVPLALENAMNEDVSSSLPVSPCLTNVDRDSEDDHSTNFEESDSTPLNPNQDSRRTSTGACSALLVREDLAKELNILTSPLDYTSAESVSTDVEFDDETIMIISATDKQRDVKISGAVTVGATVLLVDVERRKLGTRLDNLLARNTFLEKNGKRKIRIGSRCIDYHPSFRLYLYSNIPLELGTEIISQPLKKCLAINMALSSEGLQEQLLTDVLALERPEYETQLRSLEADIYHHEQQIKIAENALFEQVINLSERLQENSAIPEALRGCDELCDTARQQLEESKALYDLAKEKQEDYAHVSEHGAALLTIVSKLSKQHSYYQTPLQTSLKLFYQVITQRRRGKRSSGSSLARSAELITYITRSMCSKIARSVFSEHYDVFTILVAAEKLRLAGQISAIEWELFCRRPPQLLTKNHTSDESRPAWIAPEIWQQVVELDTISSYQGLKESILSNSGLWKEYFELPPILLAPIPSNFHQLSVFQCALLWKIFKKDQLHNVCKDLVLYQLGTNATAVSSFSIHEAYQDSSCIKPIIFFMPPAYYKEDWRMQNLKDPVDEIVALAKRRKMNDKLRFITLGGDLQITKVWNVLRMACEHGLWVVIQNCHLATEWSPELLDIFHQITLAGSKEQIMSKHGMFEPNTNPYTVTSCASVQSLIMHPRFRLWLITLPKTGSPLPAVLIRYGIKLAWDDKFDFETSVRQSFLTVWNQHKRSNKLFKELEINDVQAEPLLPYLHSLALFHSVLHRRCQYGLRAFNIPYHWPYADLSWGLEAVRLLKSNVFCSCSATTRQSLALHQLVSILYGGQVLHLLDWNSIVALSEKYFNAPNLTIQTAKEIAVQSTDMLFSRLPLALQLNDVGLSESLSREHDIDISSQIATNLSLAFGILSKPTSNFKPLSYFKEILNAFNDIKSVVHLELNVNKVEIEESSLDAYLKLEILGYVTLLDAITSQLEGIVKGLTGDVSWTSTMQELAVLLSDSEVPRRWHRESKTCPSLAVWIDSLKRQVQAINEYSQRLPSMPLTFNLAAFLNKQSLFNVLLAEWSKTSGRPVNTMDISFEFSPSSATAVDVVYLTGFVLYNASWNENESCIEELKKSEHHTSMPRVLLRPCEKNEIRRMCKPEGGLFYQYNCPVFFNDDLPCKSQSTASLSYIPLSSRLPSHIWQQQQVFLTCSGL